MFFWLLFAPIVAFIVLRFYSILVSYFDYRKYRAQGVPFNDKQGFSVMRDIVTMKKAMDDNPFDYPWVGWQLKAHGGTTLPPITGIIFPGIMSLSINSADFLDDIYIN